MAHQPVPVPFPWSLGKSNLVAPVTGMSSAPRPRPSPVPPDALADLRSQFAAQHFGFDAFLVQIAERAQFLSEACGAVVALRQQEAIVCLARCGQIAPPLGAEVNIQSGISGACLRSGRTLYCRDTDTDPLVNADACRRLGLRSIAVAPIFERAAMAGILEIFATRPCAFNDRQIDILEQLAELVTAARIRVSQGPQTERSQLAAPLRSPVPTKTVGSGSKGHAAHTVSATRRHWLTAVTSWSCCAGATGAPLLELLMLNRSRSSDGWGK